jgi:hypothetical protein
MCGAKLLSPVLLHGVVLNEVPGTTLLTFLMFQYRLILNMAKVSCHMLQI